MEAAIALLNTLRGAASTRVRETLRLTMNGLQVYRATTDDDFRKGSEQYQKWVKIEQELNARLKRYVGTMRIILGDPIGAMSWYPHPYRRDDEFTTVVLFMKLLATGYFPSVGKCDSCGAHFYARSSSSRFCSAKCREKFWENSEERKEQKRQYARNLYWLHKTTNVK